MTQYNFAITTILFDRIYVKKNKNLSDEYRAYNYLDCVD